MKKCRKICGEEYTSVPRLNEFLVGSCLENVKYTRDTKKMPHLLELLTGVCISCQLLNEEDSCLPGVVIAAGKTVGGLLSGS